MSKAAGEKKKKRTGGILELPDGRFHVVVWAKDTRGKPKKIEKTLLKKSLARQWRDSFRTDVARGNLPHHRSGGTIKLVDVVRIGPHPIIARQSFAFGALADDGGKLRVARARGVVQ